VIVQRKSTRASGRRRAFVMLAATCAGLSLGVARAEPDDPAPTPARETVSAAAVTAATVSTVTATATSAPMTAAAAGGATPAMAAASPAPAAPSASAPGTTGSAIAAAPTAAATPSTTQVASQDRWEHAGYNQDEIVYTVFITSHEPNILRCRTEIHGFYFNNGQKGEISDVQVSTVFPDKQVQAGIWSGLDEASGATYKVNCRAL
jgi:hypothetical protein